MRLVRWSLLANLALAGVNCGGSSPGQDFHQETPDAGGGDGGPVSSCAGEVRTLFVDADRDGHASGTQASVCVTGSSLPPGYAETAGDDCDDHDPSRWRNVQRYLDIDADGVGADLVTFCTGSTIQRGYAEVTGDCAPGDPTRWQMVPYLFRDADGDGLTVESLGTVCSGASLPAGYANVASDQVDCDDTDANKRVLVQGYPDQDFDGVASGPLQTVCSDGNLPFGYLASPGDDCAPNDAGRWQMLLYTSVDRDRDGYHAAETGMVCSGTFLAPPYSNLSAPVDCDDNDPHAFVLVSAYADADFDGVGAGPQVQVCSDGYTLPFGYASPPGDCAPNDPAAWESYEYTDRDADGDGYTVPQDGTLCIGDEPPAGYLQFPYGHDCDDTRPEVFASVTGYPDTDGDGVGGGAAVTFCTDGTMPAGYLPAGTDCAPDDATRWKLVHQPFVDRDGDGFTARDPGDVCIGTTLPPPYQATASGNDCDDGDPGLYRWVVLYRDRDGDGIGAGPRSIPCLGAALPTGFSIYGYDPDDGDPAQQGPGVPPIALQ